MNHSSRGTSCQGRWEGMGVGVGSGGGVWCQAHRADTGAVSYPKIGGREKANYNGMGF